MIYVLTNSEWEIDWQNEYINHEIMSPNIDPTQKSGVTILSLKAPERLNVSFTCDTHIHSMYVRTKYWSILRCGYL